MEIHRIQALGEHLIGKSIQTFGRLHNTRGKGKLIFLILRDQLNSLQIVVHKDRVPPEMFDNLKKASKESMVTIEGVLRKSPVEIKFTSQKFLEMDCDKTWITSSAHQIPFQLDDANESDESDRVSVLRQTRLDNRWLDLRTPVNNSIFKIQSQVCQLFREFLLKQDFLEIHSPKTIGCASESGASVFELKYFDQSAYLTQSPQLYKQMAINSDFGKVFEIGPVFRAEHCLSHRHLCEFTGLDIEMEIDPDKNYLQVVDLLWDLLIFIFNGVNERCKLELNTIKEKLGLTPLVFPEKPLIIEFSDGVDILQKAGFKQSHDEDLNTSNEIQLGKLIKEKYGFDLYVLIKYPRSVRPFYTMVDPDNKDKTLSYDFMLRCEEIASGAQRIHDYDQLMSRVVEAGINPETLKGYLESFKYGSKPHGGAGFGLERIVMLFLGLENVRQTSLCPRDSKRLYP